MSARPSRRATPSPDAPPRRTRAVWVLAVVLSVALAGCNAVTPDDDKDNDGVKDEVELAGRTITITLITGEVQRTVRSDPAKLDSDGDGLLDSDELLVRGTDPMDVDTDGDGLLDGDDVIPTSDEIRQAWRARGILDVNGTFLGELDACPAGGPQLRPTHASSDVPVPDQLSDGEELRGWEALVNGVAVRVTSDPCSPDTDGDQLHDHDEKRLRTDPRNPDTDGDGARDGSDADPVHDLGLAFRNVTVTGLEGTAVRLVFATGSRTADLAWPGNATATLDVDDRGSRDSLEASVIVTAEDHATGEALDLFENGSGAILAFDLVKRTVGGAPFADGRLAFSGSDGSVSFSWDVALG